MDNKVLKEYFRVFGDFPPMLMTVPYDDEKYIILMKKAIREEKEITSEQLEETFKDVDLVTENEEMDKESEDSPMEENKIRKLLKQYGAVDEEIENFMTDLYETKDEMKDDEEDFNYLDGDTMAKLKATKEGQDLIINAPKMAKDELKKAIKDYLSK